MQVQEEEEERDAVRTHLKTTRDDVRKYNKKKCNGKKGKTCAPSLQPSSEPSTPPSSQPSSEPSVAPSDENSRRFMMCPEEDWPQNNKEKNMWNRVLDQKQHNEGKGKGKTNMPSASPSSAPSPSPSTVPSVYPSTPPSFFPIFSEITVGDVRAVAASVENEGDLMEIIRVQENARVLKIASIALSKRLTNNSEHHTTQILVQNDLRQVILVMHTVSLQPDNILNGGEYFSEMVPRMDLLIEDFNNFIKSIDDEEKASREDYMMKFK